ncbi:MAG TPA: TIGR02147 family protein [Bdellovibrionota bacterium]|nr:TIGR02147 family protein [Bdellovibrionota bacterium]
MNATIIPLENHPRSLLRRELERRCRTNPRYSLRAFARALQISPTALSLVLSGKRPLSRKAAHKVAQVLPLAPAENQVLQRWAELKPRLRKASTEQTFGRPLTEEGSHAISLDAFALIADWYHYGILSLLEAKGPRLAPADIARSLGITELEASGALERLQRLGILESTPEGFKRLVGAMRMTEVSPSAVKKYHTQILSKGIEAIENRPREEMDLSAMTLAMDPAQVPYARDQITRFRRRLTRELDRKGGKKRVYVLGFQVFPVSER